METRAGPARARPKDRSSGTPVRKTIKANASASPLPPTLTMYPVMQNAIPIVMQVTMPMMYRSNRAMRRARETDHAQCRLDHQAPHERSRALGMVRDLEHPGGGDESEKEADPVRPSPRDDAPRLRAERLENVGSSERAIWGSRSTVRSKATAKPGASRRHGDRPLPRVAPVRGRHPHDLAHDRRSRCTAAPPGRAGRADPP